MSLFCMISLWNCFIVGFFALFCISSCFLFSFFLLRAIRVTCTIVFWNLFWIYTLYIKNHQCHNIISTYVSAQCSISIINSITPTPMSNSPNFLPQDLKDSDDTNDFIKFFSENKFHLNDEIDSIFEVNSSYDSLNDDKFDIN